MKRPSLKDPDFRYVQSGATDIRKTFARIRRQLKEAEGVKQAANVKPIKKETKRA